MYCGVHLLLRCHRVAGFSDEVFEKPREPPQLPEAPPLVALQKSSESLFRL